MEVERTMEEKVVVTVATVTTTFSMGKQVARNNLIFNPSSSCN
jgi:hypothetical protein